MASVAAMSSIGNGFDEGEIPVDTNWEDYLFIYYFECRSTKPLFV